MSIVALRGDSDYFNSLKSDRESNSRKDAINQCRKISQKIGPISYMYHYS